MHDAAAQQNLKLWYNKPAQRWEETIPLGNGRLGMMPDGGINTETIVLNDITLWSGAPQDANNYEAHKSLPEIRQLILAGKNDLAQDLVNKNFICKGPGSGGTNYGCFQVLGSLKLNFTYPNQKNAVEKPSLYHRELSLSQALAKTSFVIDGVTYSREYLTSFDDDVDVIMLTASKPGLLNFDVEISRPERATVATANGELIMSGQLDNGIDGKGMQYISRVKARLTGGTQAVKNNKIIIKNATSALIYIAAGTDFRNTGYKEKVNLDLKSAFAKKYTVQKQNHIDNYQKKFNRLSLQIGNKIQDTIPTDERLVNYNKNPKADVGFPVLFYQFGRYLSISSTRVGLLPPNLQGLWANQIHTPWNGDYHLDVNIQMNQWPVEVSNLSELNLPLADLVGRMMKNGEKTAKAYYNSKGWIAHVITNVWGFTEPGESASWGASNAGSGWLCNNLWDHYAFSNDQAYLKKIYPILKGSAEFYANALVKDPETGWLVTAPSVSPENTFYLPNGKTASISMGPTIDNQIVRELFTNVIYAAKTLGVDQDFSKFLNEKLKVVPPAGTISKDGRIMEWIRDYKETEPQHRHISHLYGLYPASLITPVKTPELAEAAKKSLEVRGDDGPSWSIAYKLLFWARLQDGERSGKLLHELMKPTIKTDINYGAGGGIYPNLLSAGPPFQIDGNFGGAAGIAEMLIQSHDGFINLLPSIPQEWKASGKITGVKARGNLTVDFEWKDGNVTAYKVYGPVPTKVKIKINGKIVDLTSQKS
ncbi:glycoside hydrolase family 95 protein [Pedobacter frigidisoli]|uniref:glycoside hydrolase family 95 protein n=1 Tax=Pedobacter frigidisoli TaxID=2530455 RepID=UPI0029316E8C|nr:glycoside hydrolase family 95 protein [Pedobacter frigidisoli]